MLQITRVVKPYYRLQADVWPELNMDFNNGGAPAIIISNNKETKIRIESHDPNNVDGTTTSSGMKYKWTLVGTDQKLNDDSLFSTILPPEAETSNIFTIPPDKLKFLNTNIKYDMLVTISKDPIDDPDQTRNLLISFKRQDNIIIASYWDNRPLKLNYISDPVGNDNDTTKRNGYIHAYQGVDLLLKANVIGIDFIRVEYSWSLYPHNHEMNLIGQRPFSFVNKVHGRYFKLDSKNYVSLNDGPYFQVKLEVWIYDRFSNKIKLDVIYHKFKVINTPYLDISPTNVIYRQVHSFKKSFSGFDDVMTIKGV